MLASVDTALTFPSFCSPKCEIECLPGRMREEGIERVRQKGREAERKNEIKSREKDRHRTKREIQYHMYQTVQNVAVIFHLWRVLNMTTTPGGFSLTQVALSGEFNETPTSDTV